jgi:hypothetical protein
MKVGNKGDNHFYKIPFFQNGTTHDMVQKLTQLFLHTVIIIVPADNQIKYLTVNGNTLTL